MTHAWFTGSGLPLKSRRRLQRRAWHVLAVAIAAWVAWGDESSWASCAPGGVTVAVDIGHSPAASGATSARGRPEYAFNLELATRVRDQLAASGLAAFLVRTASGEAPDLFARTQIAAARGADLFLSIHHDSVQPRYLERGQLDGAAARFSRYARGYSLFISHKNPATEASLAVAQGIGRALADWGLEPSLHHAEPIPGENRPLLDAALGIYDFADLIVLKTAAMPAVLFEAGVIVHPEEEVRLRDPFRQDTMAEAIARGILASCPPLPVGR